MVLFTKEYLFTNICSLFPSPNFPIMILPIQVTLFKKSISYCFPSPSPAVCLQNGAYSRYQSTLCQIFPTHLIYIIFKFSRSLFAPNLTLQRGGI